MNVKLICNCEEDMRHTGFYVGNDGIHLILVKNYCDNVQNDPCCNRAH